MSANPLQDACEELAAVIATVDGIRSATGAPPDQISIFPFVDVYVYSGAWEATRPNGMLTGVHTVNIDVHLSMARGTPRNAAELHRINYAIANALFKALKASTLSPSGIIASINSLPFQLTVFQDGAGDGANTVGYRFTAQVKIQGAIA